jgi:hypothetical protein
MRHVAVITALLLTAPAFAAEPRAKPSAVDTAIERGLAFVGKEAIDWKNERRCASCHHAGFVLWSMREAKQRGHAVDEAVLAEVTKWVAEAGEGKTGVPRPPEAPKALNEAAVILSLGISADVKPDAVSQQGLNRPAGEWKPLVDDVKRRQNADGGWSQAKDMASDAWATGQAMYALALAGVKPDDPVITQAQAFLVKTQRSDGSWPMTSRPIKPGGAGSKSLDPITCAGSAWAILGLVRSQ